MITIPNCIAAVLFWTGCCYFLVFLFLAYIHFCSLTRLLAKSLRITVHEKRVALHGVLQAACLFSRRSLLSLERFPHRHMGVSNVMGRPLSLETIGSRALFFFSYSLAHNEGLIH